MQVSQTEIHSQKREEFEERRPERSGCVSNMGNSGDMTTK